MYTITITKNEPNPKYDNKQIYNYQPYDNSNNPTIEIKCLSTTLTEEEFQTVKKSCLEIM